MSNYDHTTVATSICPAGWHLPYGSTGTSGPNLGGTKGGFSYLDKQMGGTGFARNASNEWRSFPNNFIYSGNFEDTYPSDRGNYGSYWSASASGRSDTYDNAYSLGLSRIYVTPGGTSANKFECYPVRCVMK